MSQAQPAVVIAAKPLLHFRAMLGAALACISDVVDCGAIVVDCRAIVGWVVDGRRKGLRQMRMMIAG